LVHNEPDFQEDGVLLVSSFNPEHDVSVAYLLDIETGKTIHQWIPPLDEIFEQTSYRSDQNTKELYGTQHPFLLENGDIIFTSGEGPLVRINACSELVWTVDRHFHHSIERSHDGYLYVPIVLGPPGVEPSVTREGEILPIRDDGFAKVTLDGEIVEEWSVKDLLNRHGYQGLLYGVGPYEVDRIHLNDVQPILGTDEYVKAGDLILSLRQLSTVLLYRPSTDEIIWLQTGPWLNQHDVDYQGDGVFTIFGNDMVRTAVSKFNMPKDISFRGYNTIWKYDQKDKKVSEYLQMDHLNIYTPMQGLHRILKNGDIFIEETENNSLYRVSAERKRWSYTNGIGENLVGALHWSRYLTPEEATFPWLDNLECSS